MLMQHACWLATNLPRTNLQLQCEKRKFWLNWCFLAANTFQDHERAYFDSADWALGKVIQKTKKCICFSGSKKKIIGFYVATKLQPFTTIFKIQCYLFLQQGASNSTKGTTEPLKPKLQVYDWIVYGTKSRFMTIGHPWQTIVLLLVHCVSNSDGSSEHSTSYERNLSFFLKKIPPWKMH